jgi:hypothetical protein
VNVGTGIISKQRYLLTQKVSTTCPVSEALKTFSIMVETFSEKKEKKTPY